jgi:hypothetical protein
MRLLVVIRKNWGGNRSANGAQVQSILTSVLCTARQQDKDAFELLVDLLRSPESKLLDILPGESGALVGALVAGPRVGFGGGQGAGRGNPPCRRRYPIFASRADATEKSLPLQFGLRFCHACDG